MARLSVNVDHVATLRQARLIDEPDPVEAAVVALNAGAGGITVHLREDRRHIQDRDLEIMRRTVKTRLNLEMAATDEMVSIALKTKPEMVTIVPEKRKELTTEGGLDVEGNKENLKQAIYKLKDGGIDVNLFIDPSGPVIECSHKLGAHGVEIHTGAYANLYGTAGEKTELEKVTEAVRLASSLGLKVHAGHGLDYKNIKAVTAIAGIEEYAIGFSIIARSLFAGLERAVSEMVLLVK